MHKQTIKDIDIKNKRVLIRVDYNVPQDEQGNITDDSRITKSLDTLRYALDQNAKLILMSHLGRPKGKPDPKYTLKPAANHLGKLLKRNVKLLSDCVGPAVQAAVKEMKTGDIVMLENLRFHEEEEKNDPAFAKELASLGEIYVNDAFGAAHRAHASTAGITKCLPAVAGFLLAKEIEYFDKATSNPDRPFVAILGGAKVSDKIKLISNLIEKSDMILIGGAMAYTFYKVQGIKIGNSKFEPAGEPAAKEALAKAKAKNFPLYFPIDRVIAQKMEKGAPSQIVTGDIPDGWSGFDIGPETVKKYKELLAGAKTVVWNGPVGVFEIPPFDYGTREIAQFLAAKKGTTTIIGGGDTAAAVIALGLENKMAHVSTGGGASLEYLEGTVLPGVDALLDKSNTKGQKSAHTCC
ncbi:MAG: phosphoglycerate kinase [Candidatus Omnitrophica bacterium]|nr:phosphoglycerate kinase [Candidatus Omnitrophota bacterium]